MKISEWVLYSLSKIWPSPASVKSFKISHDFESDEYNMDYALKKQYIHKIKQGVKYDYYDKCVLEIGCGHGGISTFLAVTGAKKVVGIDLNTRNLNYARMFSKAQKERLGVHGELPLEFLEMSAYDLKLDENQFDIVIADNVFEHFMEPLKVMQEAYKVLKPGGKLIVPIFSSVYSKYAMHLKIGLKMPWLNIFFSEKTIINVLYKTALEKKYLFDVYPGLANKPNRVRDVRRYGDLNEITYTKFKKMANESGFIILNFETLATKDIRFFAALIRRIPLIRNSVLADVFSTGASAVLLKK